MKKLAKKQGKLVISLFCMLFVFVCLGFEGFSSISAQEPVETIAPKVFELSFASSSNKSARASGAATSSDYIWAVKETPIQIGLRMFSGRGLILEGKLDYKFFQYGQADAFTASKSFKRCRSYGYELAAGWKVWDNVEDGRYVVGGNEEIYFAPMIRFSQNVRNLSLGDIGYKVNEKSLGITGKLGIVYDYFGAFIEGGYGQMLTKSASSNISVLEYTKPDASLLYDYNKSVGIFYFRLGCEAGLTKNKKVWAYFELNDESTANNLAKFKESNNLFGASVNWLFGFKIKLAGH